MNGPIRPFGERGTGPREGWLRRLWRRLRNAFFAGVLIGLPLLVTVWILTFLFGPVNRLARPLATALLRAVGAGQWLGTPGAGSFITVVGLLLTAAAVCAVGALGSNFIGRRVVGFVDRLALRIPLVKGIYGAARQFLETFRAGGRQTFRKVVLVEYPRGGCYSIAFLTSEAIDEIDGRFDGEMVNVYVPTTPNPTSGYLIVLPKSEVVPLRLSVDEAVRLIVSGGVVRPPGEATVGDPSGEIGEDGGERVNGR